MTITLPRIFQLVHGSHLLNKSHHVILIASLTPRIEISPDI